jgi:hypothetical protein
MGVRFEVESAETDADNYIGGANLSEIDAMVFRGQWVDPG